MCLVQMDMNDDSWHLVRSTPKVTAFIGGSAQKPTPIKDKEVDIILQRMDDSKVNPTQKMTFEVGESVRVLDGPFKDFSGTVEEINYEKSKLTGFCGNFWPSYTGGVRVRSNRKRSLTNLGAFLIKALEPIIRRK